MKIKKWVALIAALCMAIGTTALVACSDKGGNDSSTVSSDSGQEELPLGSVGNPYRCFYEVDYDTGAIIGDSMHMLFDDSMDLPLIKANSADYYEIAKAGEKTIIIEQADVTIVYKGESYSAQDGVIEIKAVPTIAGDHRESALLQIINATASDIELIIKFAEMEIEDGETSDTSDTSSDVNSDVSSEENVSSESNSADESITDESIADESAADESIA